MRFRALNVLLLPKTVVHSHGKLFRLVILLYINWYNCFFISCDNLTFKFGSVQVEVSGGRGKPSTIVDKDEGLGKVNMLYIFHSLCYSLSLVQFQKTINYKPASFFPFELPS